MWPDAPQSFSPDRPPRTSEPHSIPDAAPSPPLGRAAPMTACVSSPAFTVNSPKRATSGSTDCPLRPSASCRDRRGTATRAGRCGAEGEPDRGSTRFIDAYRPVSRTTEAEPTSASTNVTVGGRTEQRQEPRRPTGGRSTAERAVDSVLYGWTRRSSRALTSAAVDASDDASQHLARASAGRAHQHPAWERGAARL